MFQGLMDTVLEDVLGSGVFCYIDDIMVFTQTKDRHLQLLNEVFTKLVKAGLRLKAQKCYLLKQKVSFLGHIVDGDGVHMKPEKANAIRKYPTPRNSKKLRTLLGMASFYKKFCLGFSKQAGCLFSPTSSKAKWSWENEHMETFEIMKQIISSAPVLKQPSVEAA